MDLITVSKHQGKYRSMEEYVNELTKEMDKHLDVSGYPESWCTYIYESKPNHNGWYAFRFPGATRGGIKVNEDNVIEKIEFFRDIDFLYKESVEEAVKKFIGDKIVIT